MLKYILIEEIVYLINVYRMFTQHQALGQALWIKYQFLSLWTGICGCFIGLTRFLGCA